MYTAARVSLLFISPDAAADDNNNNNNKKVICNDVVVE